MTAVLALINSKLQTPRWEEKTAIIAKVASSAPALRWQAFDACPHTAARCSAPSITGALATTSTRRSLGIRPRANVEDANAMATTATGTRLWWT
jgi:hypothetical protein